MTTAGMPVTGQLADCQLADWTTLVVIVVLTRWLCGHKTLHCVILKCFIIKCNWIMLLSHLLLPLRAYAIGYVTLYIVGIRELSSPQVDQSARRPVSELSSNRHAYVIVTSVSLICVSWEQPLSRRDYGTVARSTDTVAKHHGASWQLPTNSTRLSWGCRSCY